MYSHLLIQLDNNFKHHHKIISK